MGRSLPKIIVLIAIGIVVATIFVKVRSNQPASPGVVYVNPGISTTTPVPPAP